MKSLKLRKKIIFVIDKAIYLRNYISSGALSDLKKKYEVIFLLNKNLPVKNLSKILKKEKYLSFENDVLDDKFNSYLNIIANKNVDKSKYFKIRIRRLYRIDFRLFNEINNPLRVINLIFKNIIKILLIKFLSLKFIYEFFEKNIVHKIPINKDLEHHINKINPLLVIKPSNAHGKVEFDLTRICENSKTKNYFIIDNWDNLSSKTVFIKKPDFVGVGGKQTKNHANVIQGMKKNNIDILGCAKYENFFNSKKILKKNYKKNYILFLGTSWPWEEEKVLDLLDNEINKNKKLYKEVRIIYRPHPLRQKKTNLYKKRWINIKYDPQINKNYFISRLMPDLEYYPKLLNNCLFAMGGLTTMLIEASIFQKIYLAIGFDDKKSFLNQEMALKWFPHLQEINRLKNVKISLSENDLINKFRSTFKTYNKKMSSINELDYFLSFKTKNYSKNLVKCIERILK